MSESICSEFLHERAYDFTQVQYVSSEDKRLLSHYRNRLQMFEKEREEWLERIERLFSEQKNYSNTLKQAKDSNDEIFKLQTRLSEVQSAIFSEKHQAMKLNRENELLKLEQMQDRRQLMEFMSLAAPKPKDKVFFEDKRPRAQPKQFQNDVAWCNICKTYNGPKHDHFVGKKTQKPKHVMRTVYLPNENFNKSALEVEMLKKQLEEEKEAYENELKNLSEESKVRDYETQVRKQVDEAKIQELKQIVQREEEAKVQATKEYLKVRHQLQTAEAQLRQQIAITKEQTENLTEKYTRAKNDIKQELNEAERLSKIKSNDFAQKFRSKVMKNEESINIIKEQYSELQSEYASKIQKLQEKINDLSQSYKDLEEKRRIASNKYKSRISELNEELNQLQAQKEAQREAQKQAQKESQKKTQKPKTRVCKCCSKKYKTTVN